MVTCGYLPSGEVWVNAKGQPVPVYLHLECWLRVAPAGAVAAPAAAPDPEAPPVPVAGGPVERQQTLF